MPSDYTAFLHLDATHTRNADAAPSSVQATTATPTDRCPACGGWHWARWLDAPDRFYGRTTRYALESCGSCALVRLKDPPPPDEMERHYGASYDRSVAGADAAGRWMARHQAIRRYKEGGALLDVGCSTGGFLASMRGPEWNLFGVEISPSIASEAAARSGATVFAGEVLAARFPNESFDVITAFHVLEHLYRPHEVFQTISRWLKPGGIFYFMVPNIVSAGAKMFGSYWYALELPRHLFHFSPAAVRSLAAQAGLEERSLTTHRELFIEASTRYLVDEGMSRLGIRRVPLAAAAAPTLPWRVIRKALRTTVFPLVNHAASLLGEGESIHAVFEKPLRTGSAGTGSEGRHR